MLNDTDARAAKPREKAYKLFDERGLYLLVKPTGARLWRFKYRHGRIERLLALGVYPAVTLKRAREKREEARRLIADGVDPVAKRRSDKAALADSFRAVVDEWLGKQQGDARGRHRRAPEVLARRRLREPRQSPDREHRGARAPRGAAPHRASRQARDGAPDAGDRGTRFYATQSPPGARRAIPAADLRGALTPVKSKHFPGLTDPVQVGALLRNIDEYQGQPAVQYALKLAPYVFVRPSELRGAKWSDFDLNGREPTWRIPAKRMKMDREHIVPLAKQAVELLRELQTFTGDGEFLFPALSYRDRPISDAAINSALRRMGYDTQTETAGTVSERPRARCSTSRASRPT